MASLNSALRTAQHVRTATRGALLWGYEQKLAREVKANGKLPRHLGLILDGNRRFARAAGLQREMGHSFGADKAHEVLQWCLELGIPSDRKSVV